LNEVHSGLRFNAEPTSEILKKPNQNQNRNQADTKTKTKTNRNKLVVPPSRCVAA
jgi:hypothetical protein